MNSDSETVEVKDYDDSYANQINDIIDTLDLESETHRKILKSRFLSEVLRYEKRKDNTKRYYNLFRFIVTIGSIFLPAILSIGQMDPAKLPKNFESVTYWGAWSISLMVTVSNGFLQLFSLDKNYFEFSLTSEQLKTEGWQYFQLSGKYDDFPDHKTAYRPFCKSIENIKRKQVEKEFSGKGESKKKKEFDFAKELKKNLPDQFAGSQLSGSPPSEASILSLLGKIAPEKVQEAAATASKAATTATKAATAVLEGVEEVVEEVPKSDKGSTSELTYPTQP